MGKSLEFCNSLASDPERSTYYDRDFNLAKEFDNTLDVFEYVLNGKSLSNLTAEWNNTIHYSIEYDSEADFDYFVSETDMTDGTLVFNMNVEVAVIERVAKCLTYFIPKGAPSSGDTVKYTVGNLVVIDEWCNVGTHDKPWMKNRITVMLPVKYDVIRA